MIALDIIQSVRKQVAGDLHLEPESADRIAVYTPFMYSDGDHCGFVLVRDPDSGLWSITDEGDVIAHASYQGVDLLSKSRKARFRAAMDFYGLRESEGQLFYPVKDPNHFGDAFFTFSQACLDITSLTKLPAERKKTKPRAFSATLRRLIESSAPTIQYTHNWHHPEFDPQEIYGVDWRVEGKELPLYVFGISNEMKCLRTTISCLHYMQKDDRFQSIAIFDNEEDIPNPAKIQVSDVVFKKFSFIEDDAEIRQFFQENAA